MTLKCLGEIPTLTRSLKITTEVISMSILVWLYLDQIWQIICVKKKTPPNPNLDN